MQKSLYLVYYLINLRRIICIGFPFDYGPDICENKLQFDIIVAGAGSAGLTVACRLSEEPTWNVLLLERGDDPPAHTEIPLRWAHSLNSDIDYQYRSEKDAYLFRGLDGNVSSIPRGKVSGGCSTINVCMYIRGNRHIFDQWRKRGCDGWSYEEVKRYFLKAEGYQIDGHQPLNATIHGIGGPLSVRRYATVDPATPVLMRAMRELGLDEMADLNGDAMVGFGHSDSTTRHGLRCSTFKAYASVCSQRTNFKFARNVRVRRVVLDESTKTAIGVEIAAPNGKICMVKASVEVVLSLGAIVSPQILMLSGIGPKFRLERVGVPTLINAPIGFNYQDHVCFVGAVFSDRANRNPTNIATESEQLIHDTMNLINSGVSTVGLTQLVAFLDTTDSGLPPDIQLMFMRISRGTMLATDNSKHKLTNMFGFSAKTAAHFAALNNVTDLVFTIVILLDVRSTGCVKLRSADPDDHPIIVPNFLRDPREIDSMLRGIKFVESLERTQILREYGLRLEHIDYEGCANKEFKTVEYWKCALQQIATGFYHPAGTVPMAGLHDIKAALTPNLKVKGVERLRVVDASVMPVLVPANPNAAVIMIAEKTADMIKLEYGKPINYFKGLF